MTEKFINKQGTTLRDLIAAGFDIDKPLQLIDTDTEWLLIPHFIEDAKSIGIMSYYGSRWQTKKEATP